jgi:hypothetical protein
LFFSVVECRMEQSSNFLQFYLLCFQEKGALFTKSDNKVKKATIGFCARTPKRQKYVKVTRRKLEAGGTS